MNELGSSPSVIPETQSPKERRHRTKSLGDPESHDPVLKPIQQIKPSFPNPPASESIPRKELTLNPITASVRSSAIDVKINILDMPVGE